MWRKEEGDALTGWKSLHLTLSCWVHYAMYLRMNFNRETVWRHWTIRSSRQCLQIQTRYTHRNGCEFLIKRLKVFGKKNVYESHYRPVSFFRLYQLQEWAIFRLADRFDFHRPNIYFAIINIETQLFYIDIFFSLCHHAASDVRLSVRNLRQSQHMFMQTDSVYLVMSVEPLFSMHTVAKFLLIVWWLLNQTRC